MLEIEMKFPVADFKSVRAALKDRGARKRDTHEERDHYFNAPDRDFARTDEALRLRCIGKRNIATYKGPKHAGPAKTRTEIEAPLADGAESAETFSRFLVALGYRPVAQVHKKRTTYRLKRKRFTLEICLDRVTNVGRFVEIEIVAAAEQKGAAQELLQQIAGELGLEGPERRSYLEMYLNRTGAQVDGQPT